MKTHVDHSLFLSERLPFRGAVTSFCLTLIVLLVNAGAKDGVLSFIGASAGAVLLLKAHLGGQRRLEFAFVLGVCLVALSLVAGTVLSGDMAGLIDVGGRVLCGVMWVLWLGTQMDWASLRRMMRAVGIPEMILSTGDTAIAHGSLTKQEWVSRRNAARLRIGSPKLTLSSWAALLGEGALQAFLRLERVEESAQSRSSAAQAGGEGQPLSLRGVSVERAEKTVLQDIDLCLKHREWLLVCGPSGAGKSSLLRLLAGLESPAEGVMNRLGTSVGSGTPLRDRLDGRVGLLLQNPEHHFIASTVGEDIAWGLMRRGMEASSAKEKATEMAQSLGVDHLLNCPCHELSFGEQRRVALAGLLVLEPKLLLLDEPTSGLDPVASAELQKLVEKIVSKTGAACVWATHDLHSWPAPAERIVLLRDQRVIFDGPTSEGLSRPWLIRAGLAISTED